MSINILNRRFHRLINLIIALVLGLGVVVSAVVFYKADYIANRTIELIAQEVPAYELLSKLDSGLIEQERFLYEFYASEQLDDFRLRYAQSNQQSKKVFAELQLRFGDIPPLQVTRISLGQLTELGDDFVLNVGAPDTDWELARQQLRRISDVRRAISPQIETLLALTKNRVELSEQVILNGLELVRFFVILYGVAILFLAFIVGKAVKAYLSINAHNQRLSLFSTRNPNPVISLDSNNKITYSNPATDKLLKKLGWAKDEVALLLAKDIEVYQQRIRDEGIGGTEQFEYQIKQFHFQCDLHWLEDQGQWDMHLTDITKRRQFEQELHYKATHHPQTGLLNHYELEKTVSQLCQIGSKFTFGLIEIRSFSELISGQGMTAASTVVEEVANSLDNILRNIDNKAFSIFHVGDKSFTLLSTSALGKPQIDSMVRLILQRIGATIFHSQYQVQLDFGFANYPQHGENYTQLHRNALAALDKSASSKDRRHVLFDLQLGEKLRYEQQMIEDLRIAIEAADFELYFQPQLALSKGDIIGAEALIRWQRNGQSIAPSEFIPLAERAGLIEELGDWILQTACHQAQKFVSLGWDDMVIAVNISPLQFARKDFLSKVTSVLEKTGLQAKNLELEVTEGVIIYNEQEAIDTLSRLKALGVHLAIDDFGTGYSSLSYLRKFDIDKLKIDQSFIQDIQFQGADRSIVRTIIELGRNLELKVIAEGVEDAEQQNILASMGCDEIQGFYFSTPLPEQKFIEFVRQHRYV